MLNNSSNISTSNGSNNYAPYGSMIGAALANLFGGYNNPADAANPYLDKMQGIFDNFNGNQYFDPFINAGKNSLGILQGQYKNLLNDPGAVMNRMGRDYQQSPGFQFQTNQALGAANRAAAAGGMLGTPAEQQAIAGQVNGMANQDYNQYLQNAMNLYGKGLSGNQDMYNTGANMSSQLAQLMARIAEDKAAGYQQQSQLAYEGQNAENQHQGGSWGSLFGGLGGLAAGGPMGGAIGSKLGEWFNF